MQTRTASGSMKCKVYAEEQTDSDDTAVPDRANDPPVSRPRKRARKQNADDGKSGSSLKQKEKGKATTSVYRGRNVGKLAKLFEMPLEIFREIFQHLEPIDLLQLSRSSKSFNCMLTSRSFKPIWSAACGAYPGLPDCPSDLNELEYTKLVFLKECHVCSANRVTQVNYQLRIRLCRQCRSMDVLTGHALLNQIPDLTEELLECLPSEYSRYMKRSCRMRTFFKASAERIVKQYIKAAPLSLPPSEAEEARAEFIKSKKGLLKESKAHAQELERWFMEQARAKQHSDDEAIKRRRDAIRDKLRGLGYPEEYIDLSYNSHFSQEWNNIVYQPRDLTPRIWENIRPKLENMIRNYKASMERMSRKIDRRKELKSAYNLPTCVSLMEENLSRDSITAEKWSEIEEQVQNEIRAKLEEHEQFLISSIMSLDRKQVPRSLSIPENVDKQFLLAPSTYFVCKSCRIFGNYSDVCNRACYFRANHRELVFDPERTAMAQAFSAYLPDEEDEHSIKTKKINCNICHSHMTWHALLLHFQFEDAKTSEVTPDHHIFEEVIEKHQPPFSVVGDLDSGYKDTFQYLDIV